MSIEPPHPLHPSRTPSPLATGSHLLSQSSRHRRAQWHRSDESDESLEPDSEAEEKRFAKGSSYAHTQHQAGDSSPSSHSHLLPTLSTASECTPSTPIPWRRLIPLLLFPIADAMTYSVLFPFVTDMLTSFRNPQVPPDKIGLYAGLGEGIMMLVEAACAPFWARAADKYGRRACLVGGFGVTVVGSVGVGWARGVAWVVMCRAILGLNPSAVITRTAAAELSTPTNRARVFSILSPSFSVGMLLGTFLGGQLGRPYGRLPAWMGGQSTLWRDWPFALPCLVVGCVDLLVVLVGWAFLVETRPPIRSTRGKEVQREGARYHLAEQEEESKRYTLEEARDSIDSLHSESTSRPDISSQNDASPSTTHPPTSTAVSPSSSPNPSPANAFRATLAVPSFLLLTFVMLLFQISTFSWDGMYTVYTYTPTALGGLGLPIDTIGLLYTASYLASFVFNPICLPRLTARYGTLPTLRVMLTLWMVLGCCVPISQWGARVGEVGLDGQRGGGIMLGKTVMWLTLGVQVGLRAFGSFGWALCDVLTLNCFDNYPELLATSSAISLIGGAGGRAAGPALSGWIFSISTQSPPNTLSRQISWMYIILISTPAVVLSWMVPMSVSNGGTRSNKGRGRGRGAKSGDDPESELEPGRSGSLTRGLLSGSCGRRVGMGVGLGVEEEEEEGVPMLQRTAGENMDAGDEDKHIELRDQAR